MTLGQRIKSARIERNISGAELSRLTGVSRSYITQIESDEHQSPSFKKLSGIAEALDTDVYQLTGIEGLHSACINCRFFKQSLPRKHVGFCRRYPPLVGNEKINLYSFPEVLTEMWCGEWKPKLTIFEVNDAKTENDG